MQKTGKAPVVSSRQEIEKVCARALARIKPSRGEAFAEKTMAERIMERLRAVLPGDVQVELAGSIAKNTNLRGDRDFDVFILFSKDYSRKELEILGLKWAKKAIAPNPWRIGYAEHPYLHASFEAADTDIVPSYKIEEISEKATSVDRSQLHTRWAKEKLSEKMCDDVRLLKAFLKRLGVYGAELRVEGFSGYLCELLIANYGGFAGAVQAASEWKKPVLDVEKHYAEGELGKKFDSPMIAVDPVDRQRNVAAVVSETSLAKFIYEARQFLKKPGEEFFAVKKEEKPNAGKLASLMDRRGSPFLSLAFKAPDVVPDVLWPQLKKAEGIFAKLFEAHGFRLIGSARWSDEKKACALAYEFEVAEVSPVKKARGPDVWHARDFDAFASKHAHALGGPFIEGTKAVAIERRKHSSALSLAKEIASNPKKYALPSYISASLKKGVKLLEGKEALKNEAGLHALREYLEKKL